MQNITIKSSSEMAACTNALLGQKKEAYTELMQVLRSIKETQEDIRSLLSRMAPVESVAPVVPEVTTSLREPKQLKSRRA